MVEEEFKQGDNEIAEEEAASDENAEKRSKKPLFIGLAITAVIAIAGVSVAIAGEAFESASVAPVTAEAEAETASKESKVHIVYKAGGIEDVEVIIEPKIKVTDKDGKLVVSSKTFPVATDKDKSEVIELDKGEYEIRLISAPILIDGSTYTIPKKAIKVNVDGSGKDVEATIELEKLEVEDMSKEQLEAVASAVENAGYTDLANSLREKAVDAPSVEGSADDVVSSDADTGTTPANDGSTGGGNNGNTGDTGNANTGGSSSGGNAGNTGGSTAPAPTPSKHEPVYSKRWIKTADAIPGSDAEGEYIPVWYSGGVKFYTYEDACAYSDAHLTSISNGTEWKETKAAVAAVEEQGYWEPYTVCEGCYGSH